MNFCIVIKVGDSWSYYTCFDVEMETENIEEHALQGNVVCVCDDIESFANEMGVNVSTINKVE